MASTEHATLVQSAVRWLRNNQGCPLALAEVGAFFLDEIPDAIGWNSRGQAIVIECKVSRGDFKKDSEKPHRAPGKGIGNLRYYLAPKGLLSAAEVAGPWGLLELVGERVFVRKKPRLVTCDHTRDVAILVAELRRATEGWRKEHERIGVAEDARAEREAAFITQSA